MRVIFKLNNKILYRIVGIVQCSEVFKSKSSNFFPSFGHFYATRIFVEFDHHFLLLFFFVILHTSFSNTHNNLSFFFYYLCNIQHLESITIALVFCVTSPKVGIVYKNKQFRLVLLFWLCIFEVLNVFLNATIKNT